MTQQFDGSAALSNVPPAETSSTELVITPRRNEVVSYELAANLMKVSRETVRKDPSLEHVRGPYGRNIGITIRSLVRSRTVKSDEQRCLDAYETGSDPLDVARTLGISLTLARRTWNAWCALNNDKRVIAARAARERTPCSGCARTPRERRAQIGELRHRGEIASAERCAVCSDPVDPIATPSEAAST